VSISSAITVPTSLVTLFLRDSSPVVVDDLTVETDAAFLTRARTGALAASRIRLAGGDASALAKALKGSPDVAIYPGEVTTAGRIELLPFLHEQSVSITAHRFGNPDPAFEALEV
jgi:RHH-type proline utilization regulon transcriptional repressor/proline dehydrogenase/delta 1-pyrroline-5-carboxylate dehydrogenase